jgi:hypothetical protein
MTQTFKQWSEQGYIIKKGSKSVGRNEKGEPLFADSQITVKHAKIYTLFGAAYFTEQSPDVGIVTADSGFDSDSIAGQEFEACRNDPDISNFW